MSVSPRIAHYLARAHITYSTVRHGFTGNAYDSASAAHLPVSNVIKAVMLREVGNNRYTLANIPASNRLNIHWVNDALNRDLMLAEEVELAAQFPDCVLGAVPALGQAHDIDVIWDDQLAQQPTLYFEAGDHRELVHISKAQFHQLFQHYPHDVISLPTHSYIADRGNKARSMPI